MDPLFHRGAVGVVGDLAAGIALNQVDAGRIWRQDGVRFLRNDEHADCDQAARHLTHNLGHCRTGFRVDQVVPRFHFLGDPIERPHEPRDTDASKDDQEYAECQ